MVSDIKREFTLDGLDCANCAVKIEKNIKELEHVSDATVNFATRTLTIKTKNQDNMEHISKKLQGVVERLEPGVSIKDNKGAAEGSLNIKELIRYGCGLLIYISALVLPLEQWTELVLFAAAFVLAGGEVLLKAVKNILRGQVFDENFLMSVATIGAFAIGEYPEGVAVMLFYQIGELFQDLAVNRSRRSIKALLDLRPDYTNILTAEGEKKVSPEDVPKGSLIIVKPGERIPLDGIVTEGFSTLDTSALTGEALPRETAEGSEVFSGCINKTGLLKIKVTKEYSQSTIAKILDLVQNAASRKAPVENFITSFARYYTPAVVGIAALLAIIPPLVAGGSFSDWFYRGLIFLVISCPCALVVSIPLGFFGGIGSASARGILVKGGNYLDALNNVDTVVFDKTGTLTKGVFAVTGIYPAGNTTSEELLGYAARAESFSNHPIALSIISAFQKSVDKSTIESYEEIAGRGIRIFTSGKEVLAGNASMMSERGYPVNSSDNTGTIVHLAVDGVYSGFITISDELKEDAAATVKDLKASGIRKLVMLTGDNRTVGEKTGLDLGLDEVHSELLPHQKVDKMEELVKEVPSGKKLVFVGDGINDAPVLARADIGVAMGGLGSDAAIEAADIVLMTDEPSKLLTALKIARKTRSVVWQNILFALGVKAVVLIMGAGGIATMWEAVFADVGVAIIAILNAMRVVRLKI